MPNLMISKVVNFLGCWNEDVFSDELFKSIVDCAQKEKGKKVKVIINETGIKFNHHRFLQEDKSTFFPINDLRTVTQIPEVSQCILFIFSYPKVKYKIIGVRCALDKDVVRISEISDEIQLKQGLVLVDLQKKEDSNWTLRERRSYDLNRSVVDAFSENKPNGELIVKNGELSHGSDRGDHDANTNLNSYKGIYVKSRNSSNHKVVTKKISREHVRDDTKDYIIETDILPHESTKTENSKVSSRYKLNKKRINSFESNDGSQNDGINAEITPHSYDNNNSRSSYVLASTMGTGDVVYGTQNRYVIETDIFSHPHSMVDTGTLHRHRHTTHETHIMKAYPQTTTKTNIRQTHSHTISEISTKQNSRLAERRGIMLPSLRDRKYVDTRKQTNTPHRLYGHTVLPSRGVVYTSTPVGAVHLHPLIYREPHRGTYEARAQYPVDYYRSNLTSHGRVLVQSDFVPVKFSKENRKGKFDQRSLISNTSKLSKSRKSYGSYSSSTIYNATEDTNNRPILTFPQSPSQIIGYRQRMYTYPTLRTNQPQMYLDDGALVW